MWNDLPRPVIIAHRGDKNFAPENTLSAFRQAADKGADAIEFDVKLTSDGEVIVLHDQTVDRTTNGHGAISRLSLAAIKELDAGILFPGQFPGERIPTLAEVFEVISHKLYMNVELTNYSTPRDALVLKVVELVKAHGLQDRIIFSSFLPANLRRAFALLPEVPRGLLTHSGFLGTLERRLGWSRDDAAYHPYVTTVNSGLVDRFHAAGKLVNVWTVNEVDDLKRMVGWGVDGIITDDPASVLEWLGRTA